jgi:hypothetical protein
MAIKIDIIEGNSGTVTEQGWELNRTFIVSGLSGDGDAMLYAAITELNTAGHIIGTTHPTVTTAVLKELRPESAAGNIVKVTAVYRSYDVNANYSYNLSGSAVDTETTLYCNDVDAQTYDTMELEYEWPTDYPNPDFASLGTQTQIHTATYLNPRPTMAITRYEYLTVAADEVGAGLPLTGNIIIRRQLNYMGTTNKSGWNVRPDDPAGSWLCLDISATKQPEQITWQVSYTFQYDSGLWTTHGQYIDPNTGNPPDDVVEDTGDIWFSMYPDKNFTLLGLS